MEWIKLETFYDSEYFFSKILKLHVDTIIKGKSGMRYII